jgi:hypothetical protein
VEGTVEREVAREGGSTIELPILRLSLGDGGKVACQNIFEEVSDSSLEPGTYLFEAGVQSERQPTPVEESLRFGVEPAAGEGR